MLTPSQVKWAASHDWFVMDNGNGTILVLDRYLDCTTGINYAAPQSWIGSFSDLRDWAGY